MAELDGVYLRVVRSEIPGRGAGRVEHCFDHRLERGSATGAELVGVGLGCWHVVGTGVLIGQLLFGGGHDQVLRGDVQLFALQALLAAHGGAADGQRRGIDRSPARCEVRVAAGRGDRRRVEQRTAIGQVGVSCEDGVSSAVFQPRRRIAKGADDAIEPAQVVVDDQLARHRDDAAVGDQRVRFLAIGHRAVGKFTVLVDLQQVGCAGQVDDRHRLKVGRVRCFARPHAERRHVLVVCIAQPLGGHVLQQTCEVAGGHRPATAEHHHLAGDLHAGHAHHGAVAALQMQATHFQQRQAAVLLAVVADLVLRVDAAQDRLFHAFEARLRLVGHGADAR